jgi:prepilin-type processing-associated H-X9-DG protein/prepilin-type N-terminal cleavage/methylation domain-containing protein
MKKGFTLIELLVVIGIIFILMALLFPALSVVEEKSNRTKCLNNLKQIAIGAVSQFGELGDKLPYRGPGGTDNLRYGYAADQLLPYVKNVKEVFHCPSSEGNTEEIMRLTSISPPFYSDYEINGYLCRYGSGARELARRQNGITDHSLAAYAYDRPYEPATSPHRGGANVAYMDGHAAFLPFEDMGDLQGAELQKFYAKGHIFAQP